MNYIENNTEEIDGEEYLSRIIRGEVISHEELKQIGEYLKLAVDPDPGIKEISRDTLYSLILVAQKSNAKFLAPILEKFFDYEDPVTVCLVIETLCSKWMMSNEYIESILHLALGVSWDIEGDVQEEALKILSKELTNESFGRKKKIVSALVSLLDQEPMSPHVAATIIQTCELILNVPKQLTLREIKDTLIQNDYTESIEKFKNDLKTKIVTF